MKEGEGGAREKIQKSNSNENTCDLISPVRGRGSWRESEREKEREERESERERVREKGGERD